MIPKADILGLATAQDLQPTTVEKDYALGWVLFGIAQHATASSWVFKGGTCLKKCFFNTYRFSEDLDFTIPIGSPYEPSEILSVLRDVAMWVEQSCGISFPPERIELEEYLNPRGRTALQGKISFAGPLQMPRKSLQRIKFDLTQDEIVADMPVRRAVNHGYRDAPDPLPQVLCYSVDEILAEKTRALYQRRGRARDVYDVVHISRSFRESVDVDKSQRVLADKFAHKGLPAPTVSLIVDRIEEQLLRANWESQLAHQLPVLPDVADFFDSLYDALSWWMDPPSSKPPLSPVPAGLGEFVPPRTPFPVVPSGGLTARDSESASVASMSKVYYGARNHLCVQITYKGIRRLIEPYSIRYPRTGNTLLYAWEQSRGGVRSNQVKAFMIPRISDAMVTNTPFTPRFLVEL